MIGASPIAISHRSREDFCSARGVITHNPPWLILWIEPEIVLPLVFLVPTSGSGVIETLRFWGNRACLRRSALGAVFTQSYHCARQGEKYILQMA